MIFVAVVDDPDAGGLRQNLADLFGGDWPFKFEVDRFAMGAGDRHADAGGGDHDLRIAEDFAGLVDHLQFFFVVSILIDLRVMAEKIVDDLVREQMPGDRFTGRMGFHLLLKIIQALRAGAADGLIGADDDPPYAVGFVERPDGDVHDDGRAVGVGDDAVMPVDLLGVDLGHDERDAVFHAEVTGVVDHHRAGRDGGRGELFADAAAGGKEGDLDALEAVLRQLFDGVSLAEEFNGLAGTFGAGQQLETLDRKPALGQHGEKFLTHGPGGTDDCNTRGHFDFSNERFDAGRQCSV